ncbi:MAG TPA: CHRD domain-containing protein [Draconibacterium sp.]|nr:CHRD domain-containing protein [Draconibacterium sp.]
MKKTLFLLVSAFFFVLTSCNSPVEEDFQNEALLKSGQKVLNFRAHLSGDQEVPMNESKAQGQAIFQLSKDGTELSYKLIVANLDDLRMAHIHLAPAGSNGGFVVWLYPSAPPAILLPGTTNGILAEGVIKQGNLTGSLSGQPLSTLIDAMLADNAYVNVHTLAFPGGEIRGQISGNMPGK